MGPPSFCFLGFKLFTEQRTKWYHLDIFSTGGMGKKKCNIFVKITTQKKDYKIRQDCDQEMREPLTHISRTGDPSGGGGKCTRPTIRPDSRKNGGARDARKKAVKPPRAESYYENVWKTCVIYGAFYSPDNIRVYRSMIMIWLRVYVIIHTISYNFVNTIVL